VTSVSLQKSECFTCKVRSCSILDTCGNETLAAVSNYKLSKSIRKGEKLFSEGDPIRGVCFIKRVCKN
jgi:CRP-like cAMP-binding protein